MQINRKAFISLIVIFSCVVVLVFIFSLHRSFSSSNSDESPAYDTDEIKSHPYETDGMDISAEDTKKNDISADTAEEKTSSAYEKDELKVSTEAEDISKYETSGEIEAIPEETELTEQVTEQITESDEPEEATTAEESQQETTAAVFLERISASYTGSCVTGHMVTAPEVTVIGFFSDGSSKQLGGWSSSTVNVKELVSGINIYDIMYENQTYELEITATGNLVPVIYLTTDNGEDVTSKMDYITGTFMLDPRDSQYDKIDQCAIKIRGRGHSTWKWDKKPYQIKFETKTSVMGLAASKKWVLLANYADKSLMRNHIGLYTAALLDMPYSVTSDFVEVYMNGEYQGVYSIGEKIEVKSERINLPAGDTAETTGYLIEVGGNDVEDNFYSFTIGNIRNAAVKFPETGDITAEQKKYIRNYISKTDSAIRALDGYEEYIDVDSFVNWLIVMELSCNVDSGFNRSCYMYLAPGEKLCMGPVWDFDLAYGNFWGDNCPYTTWAMIGSENRYISENWINYLMTDPNFTNKLKDRWNEIRVTLVNEIQNEIKASQILLSDASVRNFSIWDIKKRVWEYERPQTLKLVTYKEQVDYLSQFINNRAVWIDSAVNLLPLSREEAELNSEP